MPSVGQGRTDCERNAGGTLGGGDPGGAVPCQEEGQGGEMEQEKVLPSK